MTDIFSQQLLEASFRGVPFRVRNEAQDAAGRKIVLHEYVNSPDRFIEDLGLLSPVFSIEAFVHGSDFKARSRRLDSALKRGGFGILTLPTLGSFTVQALPFKKQAGQRSIGEIIYDLSFAAGRPSAGPAEARHDLQEVFGLGDAARAVIAAAATFSAVKTGADREIFASDIKASSNSVVSSLEDLLSADSLADVRRLAATINRESAALTQNVDDIGKLFVVDGDNLGIWQASSIGLSQSSDLQASFTRLLKLVDFGGGSEFATSSRATASAGGIPLWPETTQQRIDRNANRLEIANINRINALVSGYEIGAARDYTTRDEINEARERLEAAHEAIMLDATENSALIQSDPDVRLAVEKTRLAALDVIKQKRQKTTSTVIIQKAAKNSAFIEAFDQYSDSFLSSSELEARAIELRALNPERPAGALYGETTIFRT